MQDEKGIQVFNYQDIEVRTLLKDGEPWWVASDVCKILGLLNVSMAVNGNEKTGDSGLDDDEKLISGILISGQKRQTLLVNESGLYHLIFKSRKSEARQFRKWVTSEVLPSIRRTGSFSLQTELSTLGDALRQRAFTNEKAVPNGFFSIACELARELYYWERLLNETLDNKAQIENSVGLCFSHARQKLSIPDAARCQYHHICLNSRPVRAWAYSTDYIQVFRQWLREVYFVEKFPAYQRYRAKRIGAQAEQKQISAKGLQAQLLLARSGMIQLSLFSEAIA